MNNYSEADKALLTAVTSLITAKKEGVLYFSDAPEMVDLLKQTARQQANADVTRYFAQHRPYADYQAELEQQVQAAQKSADAANQSLARLRYEYKETLNKLQQEQRKIYFALGFGLLLSLVACVILFKIFF